MDATGDSDGQAWFWEPSWLAGEAEADDDLAAARLVRVNSGVELLRALGGE